MKLPVPMTMTQIAGFVGGKVHGEDVTVSGIATDPLLAEEGDVALVIDKQLLAKLDEIKATVVIVPEGTEKAYPNRPLITVVRPKMAIQRICTALAPKRFLPPPGVHESAVVDPTAEIGQNVAIGPCVVIGPQSKIGNGTVIMAGTVIGGRVQIGDKCLIHPGCLIADFVRIGNRVILQQGASIGSDGFGYTTEKPANAELMVAGVKDLPDVRQPLLKIPQIGTVVIEDDVEIGSNTTIDRATIGVTTIGAGTKIDNLVLIAHNNTLGKDNIVVGLTAIGGSCTTGDRTIIAGAVCIKDHVKIGKDAIVEGGSAVIKEVPSQEIHVGMPAAPAREYFKMLAQQKRVPKMYDELKDLKQRVIQLEKLLLEKQLTEKTPS